VRDLIDIMLRDSSNDAAHVLAQYEGDERMAVVFDSLGITVPKRGSLYRIDVKTFGAFFRVLYNASYLGLDDSEELLTTLTQTTFRDGIVAGLPQSVRVAHKYGTRVLDDGSRQLHDCGIVYTESPYILCVMTQGTSVNGLEHFIAHISRLIYDGTKTQL
jgi:beta-lactamase class A